MLWHPVQIRQPARLTLPPCEPSMLLPGKKALGAASARQHDLARLFIVAQFKIGAMEVAIIHWIGVEHFQGLHLFDLPSTDGSSIPSFAAYRVSACDL